MIAKNAIDLLKEEEKTSGVCCGVPVVDRILGDIHQGLPINAITELVGHAGAGKSQLCHQLVSNLLLHGSRAFYIDTEGSFSTKRLLQMMGGEGKVPLLKDLLYERCVDHEKLLMILRSLRNRLNQKKLDNLRLVVLDSIAYVVKGLDFDTYRQAINSIGIELSRIASERVAVLVTNHVVDEIDEELDSSWLKAALPSWWTHRITCRLWVERISMDSPARRLALTKSPFRAPECISFSVEEEGIRAFLSSDIRLLLKSEEAYQSTLNK